MSSIAPADVANTWREFLIEATFAEHYYLDNFGLGGGRARNAIIDKLMPSLLLIKPAFPR